MGNKVIKPVLGNAARPLRTYSNDCRAVQVSYRNKPKQTQPYPAMQIKHDHTLLMDRGKIDEPLLSERLDSLYSLPSSDNQIILRKVVDLSQDRESSHLDLQYNGYGAESGIISNKSSSLSHILEFSTNLKQGLDVHERSDDKSTKNPLPNLDGKPSLDQLQKVADVLQKSLPKMFVQHLDYNIFHKDVVLQDNIRGKVYNGIGNLMKQTSYLRMYGHLKYAYVTFELISMHQVPNEGRITVRWRIKGISGVRTLLQFWRYKLWEWKKVMQDYETWHDGISHFDVGPDGFVFKITVDKMEEERNIEKTSALDRLMKLKHKSVAQNFP